jgi:hypothetical protein
MNKRSSPHISSFVVRFVQEESPESTVPSNYRGSIRHIQTDQEYAFVRWIDAIHFMSRFVPEEIFDLPEALPPLTPESRESE